MVLNNSKISVKQRLTLLLIAILTMLLCTKSSPLYPFNDWVDSNAIFTVGKAMFNGKVPYRDIFDHKGPILHFVNGIAWLISNNSFFGLWILEIVACYFVLLYSYRTLVLFTDKRSLIVMPIYAVIVYASGAMSHGGSAEELCLPFIAYAIYVILDSFQRKEDIPSLRLYLIGVTSGIIFWVKYTMLGFYIGWIIIPLYFAMKERNLAYIRRLFLWIGAGVLSVTAIVLAYFAFHNALYDLWDVYFYTNIFKYNSHIDLHPNTIWALGYELKNSILKSPLVWGCMVIGFFYLVGKKQFKNAIQIFLIGIFGFLPIHFKGVSCVYYSFIFSSFAIFAFVPLYNLLKGILLKLRTNAYTAVLAVMCICILPLSYFMSNNTYLLHRSKSEAPQYQFAEIINQVDDATILNYGTLDLGCYTTTGIIPTNRYFCCMNVDQDEAIREQEELIAQGAFDFIVTKDRVVPSDLYEECARTVWVFEDYPFEYILFRKVEK